jgi:hypothetical protein
VKRIGILLFVGVLALTAQAQAVTLVNPDGRPVGGLWQRWADDAHAPTYRGIVVFRLVSNATMNVDCSNAIAPAGCYVGEVPSGPLAGHESIILSRSGWRHGLGEVWPASAAASQKRETLYYELAHVFDYKYLTDADRLRLMRLWRYPRWPHPHPSVAAWTAGEQNLNVTDAQPGLDWFAEDYTLCAIYPRWSASVDNARPSWDFPAELNYLGEWDSLPGSRRLRWAVAMQRRSCHFIDRVSRAASNRER